MLYYFVCLFCFFLWTLLLILFLPSCHFTCYYAVLSLCVFLFKLSCTESGIGATIGAGVYILVGPVAKEHTGPAIAISFLIAGIAAGLSAFCYAELACRCPSAGSAYHYSYICVGEG